MHENERMDGLTKGGGAYIVYVSPESSGINITPVCISPNQLNHFVA